MTEGRAKHLAELVAKVSWRNFCKNENIKIEMSKTSDKICSWKCTNISDQICNQSRRHAEHRWWHDEEVHCCHQVSNKTRILQKIWFAIFLPLFFSRNQKEGQPGSWTTYGNVKVFNRPLILHYEMHLRLRLWALLIHVYLSIELFFIMRCIWALLIPEYLWTLLRSTWRIQDLLSWWRNTTQYWWGKKSSQSYSWSPSRIIGNLYFKQNQW